MSQLETGNWNKVLYFPTRFKYQPPFADSFADIIANLIVHNRRYILI